MPRPRLLLALAATSAFAPAPRTKARLVDRQVRWPWQKKTQAEEGEGGDDITNSPVFLQKKVGVLQNELKQLDVDIAAAEEKKAANWDEWGSQIENMRTEFSAVKKRTQEARTRAEAVERAGVLDQLLGPIDNFDRAIVAQKTRADASEGVQKVVDRYTGPVAAAFDEAFKELGAKKIDEVGVPFDPTIHEAAMTDFDADAEPDTVIKVFQYGVKVGDRLRPRNWMRGVRTERGHLLGQQAAILDEATLEGETQAAAAARLLDELQEGRREVAAARSTEVT